MFNCYPFIILFIIYTTNAQAPSMGPYVLEVKNVTSCTLKEKKPIPQLPWAVVNYVENGRSYLRVNFTIPRDGITGIQMHGVMSMLNNKTLTKVFSLESSTCSQHNLFRTLSMMVQMDFNPKDCSPMKGTYVLDRMDVDKSSHLMSKTLPHGVFVIHFWWTIPKGVLFCEKIIAESRKINS